MLCPVVIEKGERSYSAYATDLPSSVSVGDTLKSMRRSRFSSKERGEARAHPFIVELGRVCGR